MNVIAFHRETRDLPADKMQEVRDIGFTHYRRVSDDPIGQIAILRAAALILCDFALREPNPMTGLDVCLGHLREETASLIAAETC